MVLRLLIDAVHAEETRVVIADNGRINDFDFVTSAKKQVKGNIYLAKITRVEPSLQAAFVEYGSGKQGFLPFAEIHPDYYQIPTADRERLLKEAEIAEEAYEAAESSTETVNAQESISESSETHKEPLPDPEAVFLNAEPAIIAQLQDSPVTYSEEITESTFAKAATEPAAAEEPKASQEHTVENITDAQAASSEVSSEQTVSETSYDHGQESNEPQEVETLASEEDAVAEARPAAFHRRYKIQEVIKRNQIVLVQVIKEERGNKGVSLTTFMSLAGRYCVLMPNSPKGGGISRKISSGEDRRRLKEISAELKTARGMSAIIRTAGIDRTRVEIQRDYEYLVKLWEGIREQTLSSTAPALIYEEGDLIKRTIRDLYSNEIEEIIVEGEEGYNQAKSFLNMILPSHTPKVKLYQDNLPVFYAYNIEDQLNSMYDPIVKLRSGGYIVINPTEALISIDVNSGRSTGERNIEETATKTNLEAANEIARQLRLRDLAGLVVVDFIDMMDSRNRRSIERAMKDALRLDRAKIQIGRISPFGLLEMSRQRLRPSISESSTTVCSHCLGKGVIRSSSSVSLQIIRAIEKEVAGGVVSEIKIFVTESIALSLLNTRRDTLSSIEKKYDLRITVLTDELLAQGNFRIEKVKGARRGNPQGPAYHEPVSIDQTVLEDIPSNEEDFAKSSEPLVSEERFPTANTEERPRRNRRGGRGRRGGNRNFNEPRSETTPASTSENITADNENRPQSERNNNGERNPNRNRRGGQGQRRWRDGRDRNSENPNAGTSTNNNVIQYSGNQQDNRPNPSAHSQSSVPPLEQQAQGDSKPKKGWWRRIVES